MVWCTDDLVRALDGTDLAGIELVLEAGGNPEQTLTTALEALTRLGLDPATTQLAFRADPLGALAATGAFALPFALVCPVLATHPGQLFGGVRGQFIGDHADFHVVAVGQA